MYWLTLRAMTLFVLGAAFAAALYALATFSEEVWLALDRVEVYQKETGPAAVYFFPTAPDKYLDIQ